MTTVESGTEGSAQFDATTVYVRDIAAPHPLGASGVRTALSTHGRADARRRAPGPRGEGGL